MTCINKQYSFIQLRRGSEAEFTASNIILASGEPAYAVDTRTLKIGDGITPWNSLLTINTWNIDAKEPDGFVNRNDSQISFNNSTLTFSIAPKSPATKYVFYNDGVKVIKTSTENLVLPSSTALYYIHFDKNNNTLSYKTTGFDFDTDIPVAQIYYNASDVKVVYFGEERHGVRMDNATHEYLHNVLGTQYINGLSISNYSTSGDGSLNSDASIAIGNGLIYDEDIKVNITNSASPSNPFEQVLSPSGMIPVYYKTGISGIWTNATPTYYPVKVGTTAQYNLYNGGSWSASDSSSPTNNRYIASWICATSQENYPIIAIMGQRIDSSLEQATSNNSWSNLNLNGLPIVELRPLYRLIYDTKSSFTNGAKAFLIDVLDIRSHIDTITGLPQNDHGNLYGLADDDHYQYIHLDNTRIINANHIFTNGLISSGTISSVSGNFINNLTVNLIPVSVSGHTHTSSDIANFNTAVSGLLSTISNSGDNRVLTSTGTDTGINAESNLTFDGLSINTGGSGIFTSGINIGEASVTGTITGLSTTSTVPAIRFQSITANHTNSSHVIFDWYKNLSTRIMYIDGAGNIYADSSNGNYIASSTSPSAGNGAFVGHGMRRHGTTSGFDFAWGESISSITEPGIDLYPIGGTHIANGILLRLSKDSSKSSTALLINGSGNVGIGTASPVTQLHVVGSGVFANGKVGINKTNPSYHLDVNGDAKFTQVYPTVYSFGSTAGTVTTNVQNGQIFDITVTGATTLANPTNSIDGVTLRWRITQDVTGGHAITLDTKFNIPSSATTPLSWSTSGNFTDILAATYHSGRDKWDVVAFVPGY